MQLVIDLHRHADDRVEGCLLDEQTNTSRRFSGWLQLLRLLKEHLASLADPAGRRPPERP